MFRSMLFVPANNARRVEKAFALAADAVILDLEDAIPGSEKAGARAGLAANLPARRARQAYVRVNGFASEHFALDIAAAVAAGADGIVLPKVESRDALVIADWLIGQEERRRGPSPPVDLIPHVETAAGLARAAEILGVAKRVRRAGFGGGDFTTDLGLAPSRDEREFAPYRAALVLASRQAGLEPPIDSVWADLRDAEGLRATAEASRRAGFQGRRCIHPDQIAVLNEVYAPTAEEIARAERIVAAFARAEAEGTGAIRVDDALVDEPVAERARRILRLRDRLDGSARAGTGTAETGVE